MSEQKMQLVGDIGRLESELAQAEAALRDKEAKQRSAKSNRTVGLAALLIGILIALFLNIFLGGFIALIGLLTALTAIMKSDAQGLKRQQQQIADLRGTLAEKRAMLAV